MLDSASHALRDLMLDAGVATETQLNEMEEEQSRSGKSLFEVVTDFGMISEIDLMRLIADNLGSEVVDSIEVVPTTRRFPHDDVPVEPVVIEKAEILEDYTPAK